MTTFLAACRSNNFEKLQEQVNNVICEGYSVVTFIQQLQRLVIADSSMSDLEKAKVTIKMAEVDAALVEGASEFLQLLDLGATLLHTFCR